MLEVYTNTAKLVSGAKDCTFYSTLTSNEELAFLLDGQVSGKQKG